MIDGLYEKLIEEGLGYFFPSGKFESLGRAPGSALEQIALEADLTTVTINLLGSGVHRGATSHSDAEVSKHREPGEVIEVPALSHSHPVRR